jgi:hypothetical protein
VTVELLVDSKPIEGVKDGENLRYIGSLLKKKTYSKFSNVSGLGNQYKDREDVAIRNFLKGLVSSPPLFNLPSNVFQTDIEVIEYIKSYKPGIKISRERVAKYRLRSVSLGKIHKTKESETFLTFVKHRFPAFDSLSFYIQPK